MSAHFCFLKIVYFHQPGYHFHFTVYHPYGYEKLLLCKLTYGAYLNKSKDKSISSHRSKEMTGLIASVMFRNKTVNFYNLGYFCSMYLLNELKTSMRHCKRTAELNLSLDCKDCSSIVIYGTQWDENLWLPKTKCRSENYRLLLRRLLEVIYLAYYHLHFLPL